MKTSPIKKRIGLNEQGKRAVAFMSEELRKEDSCLKFNDSQLVEQIVEIFSKKYFAREKKHLEKTFFNQKKALLGVLKDFDSSPEWEESLAKLLGRKK